MAILKATNIKKKFGKLEVLKGIDVTVSEGEIRAAIRRNPPALDVDSVKRRTRSGMGRCQGGFCGPKVMEILSRELGIPMEQVEKNLPGSYLTVGPVRGGKEDA